MEAYSDNAGKGTNLWYSRITFCSRFFNNLQSLDDAIKNAKSKPSKQQDVLEIWNNRARCFFHEVTRMLTHMVILDLTTDENRSRLLYE